MLDYIVTIAISAFFVPNYLAVFWPVLKTCPYNTIGGIVVILALVIINVVGIKEAARLNIVLAVLDLATQVLRDGHRRRAAARSPRCSSTRSSGRRPHVAAVHLRHLHRHHRLHGHRDGLEHGRRGRRTRHATCPGPSTWCWSTVLVVYIGMSLVALSAMPVKYNVLPVDPADASARSSPWRPCPASSGGAPTRSPQTRSQPRLPAGRAAGRRAGSSRPQEPTGEVYQQDGRWVTKLYGTQLGSAFLEDPVQGVVTFIPDALAWLRGILKPWVGILAATILLIATNAGLIGVSRLAYSLGQHRQVPPVLGRVHPKRMTPYVSIIVFGGVACSADPAGQHDVAGRPVRLRGDDLVHHGARLGHRAAVQGAGRRAALPHAPEHPRSAAVPCRCSSVIGGLGTFTVWCVVVATHAEGRLIGFAWMAVGVVVYVVYRRAKGLLAHADGRAGRRARDHAGRHRLRPDPRAHRRLAHQPTR